MQAITPQKQVGIYVITCSGVDGYSAWIGPHVRLLLTNILRDEIDAQFTRTYILEKQSSGNQETGLSHHTREL